MTYNHERDHLEGWPGATRISGLFCKWHSVGSPWISSHVVWHTTLPTSPWVYNNGHRDQNVPRNPLPKKWIWPYFPNSVCMSKRPCWGRINMSPSLLQKAFFSMDVLARYIWMASPSRRVGSPLPAIVFSPSTKSTLSEAGGRSNGCHANWVGLVWTLGLSGRKQDSS